MFLYLGVKREETQDENVYKKMEGEGQSKSTVCASFYLMQFKEFSLFA